jgi:hypothetical protein
MSRGGERDVCPLTCLGCPASRVTENVEAYPELSRRASGAALFGVLTARRNGPIRALIDAGVTTHEALNEAIIRNDSTASDQVRYGDLEGTEIISLAIDCMLQVTRGECTLVDA